MHVSASTGIAVASSVATTCLAVFLSDFARDEDQLGFWLDYSVEHPSRKGS